MSASPRLARERNSAGSSVTASWCTIKRSLLGAEGAVELAALDVLREPANADLVIRGLCYTCNILRMLTTMKLTYDTSTKTADLTQHCDLGMYRPQHARRQGMEIICSGDRHSIMGSIKVSQCLLLPEQAGCRAHSWRRTCSSRPHRQRRGSSGLGSANIRQIFTIYDTVLPHAPCHSFFLPLLSQLLALSYI